MKKINFLLLGVSALSIMIIFGLSCKKEAEEETPVVTPAAEDAAYYKSSSEDAMAVNACADDILTNTFAGDAESQGKKSTLASCATVTLVPGALVPTYPKVLTIDFGPDSCLGNDGRSRSGTIIATLDGKLNETGTTVSFQLVNYKVDTIAISGTFALTNDGATGIGGNKQFTWTVTSMNLVSPNADISYSGMQKFEWERFNTPVEPTDDILILTEGNSTFTNNGKTTSTSTSSLQFKFSCMEPVAGSTVVTVANANPITVNYGDGTCDGSVSISTTYTVAGHDYTYTEVLPIPY